MSGIVLHHYPPSPVSEKVRVCLGVKGLDWHSVIIPRVPPKPKLMPLTGGFRLTPVMQIGADIYCDSVCIIRELENRFPKPTLFPDGDADAAWAIGRRTDQQMFPVILAIVFSDGVQNMPEGFLEDRAQLYFGGNITIDSLRAQLADKLAEAHTHFAWIEAALQKQSFLGGDAPGAADAFAYYVTWFLLGRYKDGPAFLAAYPNLMRWQAAVKAIGHGHPFELTEDAALSLARASEPLPSVGINQNDPSGFEADEMISVRPENDKNITTGRLIGLSADRVSVLRHDPDVGPVAVHFPRAGYVITRVKA